MTPVVSLGVSVCWFWASKALVPALKGPLGRVSVLSTAQFSHCCWWNSSIPPTMPPTAPCHVYLPKLFGASELQALSGPRVRVFKIVQEKLAGDVWVPRSQECATSPSHYGYNDQILDPSWRQFVDCCPILSSKTAATHLTTPRSWSCRGMSVRGAKVQDMNTVGDRQTIKLEAGKAHQNCESWHLPQPNPWWVDIRIRGQPGCVLDFC